MYIYMHFLHLCRLSVCIAANFIIAQEHYEFEWVNPPVNYREMDLQDRYRWLLVCTCTFTCTSVHDLCPHQLIPYMYNTIGEYQFDGALSEMAECCGFESHLSFVFEMSVLYELRVSEILLYHYQMLRTHRKSCIRESVDSLCRDEMDAPTT